VIGITTRGDVIILDLTGPTIAMPALDRCLDDVLASDFDEVIVEIRAEASSEVIELVLAKTARSALTRIRISIMTASVDDAADQADCSTCNFSRHPARRGSFATSSWTTS